MGSPTTLHPWTTPSLLMRAEERCRTTLKVDDGVRGGGREELVFQRALSGLRPIRRRPSVTSCRRIMVRSSSNQPIFFLMLKDAPYSIFVMMKMDCVHIALGSEASECKLHEHVGVEAEGVEIVMSQEHCTVIASSRSTGGNSRNGGVNGVL